MTLLEARHGSTLSEAEIRPWPNLGTATTRDLLSSQDLIDPPILRRRTESRPASPIGLSVGQVLAAQGALLDNWDGQGAIAPDMTAIRAAQGFIAELPSEVPPAVSASTTGGVLLEWESESVDLLLEIRNDGAVEALVSWSTGTEVEGPLATLKQQVLDALAVLLDDA